MSFRAMIAAACVALAAVGCKSEGPPVPAASDPQGKDLVAGAVVAAAESSGGIRLYKIVHVDDYPDPIGYELHMIAFDPKVQTFQEASSMRANRKEQMKIALDHLSVQMHLFMKRDHRVIANEPVTPEELAPYEKARTSRN